MRGVGRAAGAITFVNALPTGVGCAVGVGLPVEVEVELLATRRSETPRISIDPDSDTPLVRASVLEGLQSSSEASPAEVRIRIRSKVPLALGLKSSSAVSSAVVQAVAHARREPMSVEEIARRSADASQRVGVSATGAFDDAMAALTGDVVVADNARRRVLRRERPDPEWSAVLWIPPRPHEASPRWLDAFRSHAWEGQMAVDRALAGDYLGAMTRNTELVERVMGYDYQPLRGELERRGALASGVSGMGPTLAAVVSRKSRFPLLGAFPRTEARILETTLGPVRPAEALFL